MGRLDGKVALISGAARGQGEAEARLFAAEGASVALGDIRRELGEQVAGEITAAGGKAVFTELDVSREADWARAVGLAESTFGKLDILVNNAAIIGLEGIMETSIELWNRVIAVNQTGTFLGMRAAIPAMRRAGGGSIVNISSVLATMGSGNSASYTASKGAVTALTRTVSVELATEGIRVNAVHPGGVETPMAVECLGDDVEARRALVATHPMGRIGEPGEIATGVLFLASDEASFVTGASLVIDGGNTVW
jgi:NAD(P)-dependent dehydrogenase (short-subunit alcohol dehydrogenase family)